MKLTKTIVAAAAPRAQRYRLNDSLVPGLVLLVLPSGARTYYLRFRQLDGRQLELKLGTPAELSPDDARRLAREALAQVREGRRPTEERRALRQAESLEELARQHMERHAKRKRSGACDEANWRLHILPALGASTKVAAVRHEDVARWHAEHRQPITANRALRTLSVAMRLAEQWGWRPRGTNSCKGVRQHPERARRRYLAPDEMARMREALARWGHPATPPAPEPPTTVRYEFEITDEHDLTLASGDAATQEEAEREGRHYLSQYRQDGPCTLELRRVEVLEVSSPEPAPAAAEPPLWRVMQNAFNRCRFRRDQGFAAQIFAVRDWVAPEEAPPVAPTDSPAYLHWQQRQAIRALLTFEAARAEAEAGAGE